jgi:RNA polymerase sigma-70 factor (ECF subfamily)
MAVHALRPGAGEGPPRAGATTGREAEAARLADLVARSSRGHEDAFAQLYDLTSARIHGLVLRVLRSAEHAAEVTQEVYVEVWRQSVEQKLDVERVRRGLESLTEIQREALSLAYFGGYTQTQVAALLQLPLGTVKTRIRDGLIGLRDALGVEA